jgi:hypothetical protein
MDTAVLVRTEREAAWKLLEDLEKEQFPMTAAFWQYLPDAETWRLVIATPLVDEIGSIAAYTRLQTLLNQLPEEISEGFSVANITLLSPTAEQLVILRKRYGNVTRNRSHTRRISLSPEEAYIYFLE